jgi:hypothetical protein
VRALGSIACLVDSKRAAHQRLGLGACWARITCQNSGLNSTDGHATRASARHSKPVGRVGMRKANYIWLPANSEDVYDPRQRGVYPGNPGQGP